MKETLTIIEPKKGWIPINMFELIHYKELLYFLTWRDIKVQYRQTVLGATWAILQPFMYMVIFTILFGHLAKMPSEGIPYPIFVYAGLWPWTFFANAVNSSGNSLVGSAHLITKVYFPRIFIPTSKIIAELVNFLMMGTFLFFMMVFYRVNLTWNILLLPIFVVLLVMLVMGVGSYLSALNVMK